MVDGFGDQVRKERPPGQRAQLSGVQRRERAVGRQQVADRVDAQLGGEQRRDRR
jgi:hypothetical protein